MATGVGDAFGILFGSHIGFGGSSFVIVDNDDVGGDGVCHDVIGDGVYGEDDGDDVGVDDEDAESYGRLVMVIRLLESFWRVNVTEFRIAC